ncbi:HEAT repeat-containing protein 6 [Balamuthia mandrillaris]
MNNHHNRYYHNHHRSKAGRTEAEEESSPCPPEPRRQQQRRRRRPRQLRTHPQPHKEGEEEVNRPLNQQPEQPMAEVGVAATTSSMDRVGGVAVAAAACGGSGSATAGRGGGIAGTGREKGGSCATVLASELQHEERREWWHQLTLQLEWRLQLYAATTSVDRGRGGRGSDTLKEGELIAELEALLPLLQSAQLPDAALSKQESGRLVELLGELACLSLTSGSNHRGLTSTSCQLLGSLLSKQLGGLHDTIHPDSDRLLESMARLISATSKTALRDPLLLIDALRVLTLTLGFKGGAVPHKQRQEQLLKLLMPLADGRQVFNKDVVRLACLCIGNLASRCGSRMSNSYPDLYRLLYATLSTELGYGQYTSAATTGIMSSSGTHRASSIQLLSSSLRSLAIIISESYAHEPQLTSLLTTLKQLLFGAPVSSAAAAVATAAAVVQKSSSDTSECQWHKQQRAPEDGKRVNSSPVPTQHILYSSDSETSDGEAPGEGRHLWKVQFHAMACLQAVARRSPKKLYAFWTWFLPSSPHSLSPSLFTLLLHDSHPKIRSQAAAVLTAVLEGSKPFMVAVEEHKERRPLNRAFVPFSQTLAHMIREVHNGLFAALDKENNVSCLNQLLRCLTALVSAAPYEKLSDGFLTAILSRLKSFVSLPEVGIRSEAFVCLAAVFGQQGSHNEVSALLELDPFVYAVWSQHLVREESKEEEMKKQEGTHTGSLVESILVNMQQNSAAVSLQVAALQCLGSLCSAYPHFFVGPKSFSKVFPPVFLHLEASSSALRFAAAKVTEDFAKSLKINLMDLSGLPFSFAKLFWTQLLSSPLPHLFQDASHSVRACVCSVLSHIPPLAFEQLPQQTRLLCITLILGAVADEAAVVKAAASRALGIYVLFPCMQEDYLFLGDCAGLLVKSMQDTNLNVRVRSCWSLANLCDTLASIRRKSESEASTGSTDELFSEIPISTFRSLTSCLVVACSDNDRVRCNAVRALGNFCRFLSPQMLCADEGLHSELHTIISSLIECLGQASAKVGWNTCYALNNLLQNSALFQCSSMASGGSPFVEEQKDQWNIRVISALTNTLQHPNFKIRINAAMALRAPVSRRFYGNALAPLWYSLLAILSPSLDFDNNYQAFTEPQNHEANAHQDRQRVVPFSSASSERRYMTALKEQANLTLLHLLCLLEEEDGATMVSPLRGKAEHILVDVLSACKQLALQKNLASNHCGSGVNQQSLEQEEQGLGQVNLERLPTLAEYATQRLVAWGINLSVGTSASTFL